MSSARHRGGFLCVNVPAGTSTLEGMDNASLLLRSSPVQPGDLCRRVICTKQFIKQLVATLIICAGVHVLSGYMTFTHFGKEPFPAANDTSKDACLVPMKGPKPEFAVNLVPEIFADAILTAFFTSGAQLPQRIRDVRKGMLPLVQADAFPGGCPYSCCFPPCRKAGGVPASRHDHWHNLASWFGLTLSWGVGWSVLTLVILEGTLRLGGPRCFSPWEYIAARAVWTDIEAILVVSGSFVLWSTRGEGTGEHEPGDRVSFASVNPTSSTGGGLTAVKPLASLREPLHRDQLASPTASNFVSVD